MPDFHLHEQLNNLIDRWRPEIIADTQKLIAINSEYGDDSGPGRPFGSKIALALDAALDLGAAMGFATHNVDGYMGEIDMGQAGQGKKIGIIAHIDVVPAGDGWDYPPFAGRIVDGRLYGRGSVDDKGPLVAALYAMRAIKESGLPCRNHARYLIGTDEESGFRCIKYYLSKQEQPWGGFSPDGEFPVIYGEKGTYRFKCEQQWPAAAPDIDSERRFTVLEVKGGARMNVVPESARAVLRGSDSLHTLAEQALAADNPEARLSLGHEGQNLLIEARGIGAHSATPWFGLSANNLLLNFLRQLPLSPPRAENYLHALADLFADGYLGQAAGLAAATEDFGPLTVSLGILKAGPEGGSASFDLRYPHLDQHDQLWDDIARVFAARQLPVELLQDKPGLLVLKESFLVQSLLRAYQQTSGRNEEPVTIGGGTYCRAMNNFVAFGPLFPGQRELAHERNEYILVEDLMLCAKIYAQALYNLLK